MSGRGGKKRSREGIRKAVFDWAMGPLDLDFVAEQILCCRMIDTDKFTPGDGTADYVT